MNSRQKNPEDRCCMHRSVTGLICTIMIFVIMNDIQAQPIDSWLDSLKNSKGTVVGDLNSRYRDGTKDDKKAPDIAYFVIKVEGSGYIPHFSNGSWERTGAHEESLTLRKDESLRNALKARREKYLGKPCKMSGPVVGAGAQELPTFWNAGPMITVTAGPFLNTSELYRYTQIDRTWKKLNKEGPSLNELKKASGCG